MATESEKSADTGNLRANSIMSLFLKNKIPDSAAKKSTKGLTYDEIIGQNFVFFVAGYETTATTLTWALLELARNSDLQEKCRAEAQSIDFSKLADLKNDVIPNIDATIKETLRIHSPVQVHLRRCVHDTNINGQWFRSGTNVEIPVQALHTCEEYWGENAKKFDVQRWIDDPNLEKNQFYMPFGDGPRNCIGMRFANMIVRASLAHIVNNFKVQFPPTFTDDIHQIQTITAFIRSNKDIPLIFTKV